MRGLQERREAAHLMRYMRRVRFFFLGLPDEVHEEGEVGEGGRQQRVRVEELDGQVEPPVLPLCVQVVVDLLVCDRYSEKGI